jgi:hypothetical protein
LASCTVVPAGNIPCNRASSFGFLTDVVVGVVGVTTVVGVVVVATVVDALAAFLAACASALAACLVSCAGFGAEAFALVLPAFVPLVFTFVA